MAENIEAVILFALGGTLLITFVAFLYGWPVMALWNWLMPSLFGLKTISFWEAIGLNILCSFLFKNSSSSSSK